MPGYLYSDKGRRVAPSVPPMRNYTCTYCGERFLSRHLSTVCGKCFPAMPTKGY